MDTSEMRIELLRLAQRNDLTAGEIIARAEEFEAYILGLGAAGEVEPPRRRRGGRPITGREEPGSAL